MYISAVLLPYKLMYMCVVVVSYYLIDHDSLLQQEVRKVYKSLLEMDDENFIGWTIGEG